MLAELAAVRRLVERLCQAQRSPVEWLSTPEATRLEGVSAQCVRDWCKQYHVGIAIGHQWVVDRPLLADRRRRALLPR